MFNYYVLFKILRLILEFMTLCCDLSIWYTYYYQLLKTISILCGLNTLCDFRF